MKKDDKINSKFNKYAKTIIAAAIIMLLSVTGLVVWIDPFFQYHAPLKWFPYQVDNQLSQNPGMAKHMEYDSVILGSSMTVNFNTHWFEEEMGLNTLKLSSSGAYPKDIANIMDVIFDYHPETKKVFLGVDVINYSSDTEQTKYPLPRYLYDRNIFNDVSYVLNKDVLLEYILRQVADPEPTDLATVYSSWWTDEYYNIQWVMHNYEPAMVEPETAARDYFAQGIKDNMEANILPYIKDNPDTEFIIFYPPYSILFWNDVLNRKQLEATLYEYELISEMLFEYPNVRIFFFTDEEEIITDLNHYADYTHYHPDFNHYMTRCFGDGTDEVTDMKQVKEHIDNMRRIASEYDFEPLLSKEWY